MSESQDNFRLCPVCDQDKPANSFSGKTCISCKRWFLMNIDIYYHSSEGLVCPSKDCGLFTCPQCRLKKFLIITSYIEYNSPTCTCYFCGLKTILKSTFGNVPKCSICRKIHYDKTHRGSLNRCTCHERVDRMCDCCIFNKINRHSDSKKLNNAASVECFKEDSMEQSKKIRISLTSIAPQYQEKARDQLINRTLVVNMKRIDLKKVYCTNRLTIQPTDMQIPAAGPSNHSTPKCQKKKKNCSKIREEEAVSRCYNVVSVSDTRLVFQKPKTRKKNTSLKTVNPAVVSLNGKSRSPVFNRELFNTVFDDIRTEQEAIQLNPAINNNKPGSTSSDTNREDVNNLSREICPAEKRRNFDGNFAALSPVLSFGIGQRHRNSKTVGTIRPFNFPLTLDVAIQTEPWSESAELERSKRRILELEAIITNNSLLHSTPTHKLQPFLQYSMHFLIFFPLSL